jgi:hypothetical protein
MTPFPPRPVVRPLEHLISSHSLPTLAMIRTSFGERPFTWVIRIGHTRYGRETFEG